MKTKLLISIVAVISAVADLANDASTKAVPENTYCEIVRDWEKVLC